MRVVIEQWDAVAAWRWDMPEDDVCGICRNPYDSTCSQCRYPGEECPLRKSSKLVYPIVHSNGRTVMGECNHSFHMHCIVAWVRQESSQERCPMCRQGIHSLPIKTLSEDSNFEIQSGRRNRERQSRRLLLPLLHERHYDTNVHGEAF
jgi:anaphase-promoting complex subunit 11